MNKPKTPKFGSGSNADKDKAQDALRNWFDALTTWGDNVRVDIARLEGALHLPKGDPGPPPDSPWV